MDTLSQLYTETAAEKQIVCIHIELHNIFAKLSIKHQYFNWVSIHYFA